MNKIIIPENKKDVLKTKCKLYIIQIKSSKLIEDKYYVKLNKGQFKILKLINKTLEEFIKEYRIPIEFKRDETSYKKKIIPVISKIAKDAINKFKYQGFNLYRNDSEDIDEFINGSSNYLDVITYDAWKFTNGKARTEEEYDKFNTALIEIEQYLNNERKKYNVEGAFSSEGGDWDDGCISYYINGTMYT